MSCTSMARKSGWSSTIRIFFDAIAMILRCLRPRQRTTGWSCGKNHYTREAGGVCAERRCRWRRGRQRTNGADRQQRRPAPNEQEREPLRVPPLRCSRAKQGIHPCRTERALTALLGRVVEFATVNGGLFLTVRHGHRDDAGGAALGIRRGEVDVVNAPVAVARTLGAQEHRAR